MFVTGDIHTFIAGDVRTAATGETVATEFVGGSITSPNFGETNLADRRRRRCSRATTPTRTPPPAIIDALRSINPWVDQADFDHHGYGLVKATPKTFDVTLKRVVDDQAALDPRPRATKGYRYRVERGQRSVKGVNGPARATARFCASTRPALHAACAATAIARSWIARPVESKSVTASGVRRPGASPASTAPRSVTLVAA